MSFITNTISSSKVRAILLLEVVAVVVVVSNCSSSSSGNSGGCSSSGGSSVLVTVVEVKRFCGLSICGKSTSEWSGLCNHHGDLLPVTILCHGIQILHSC